MNGREGRSSLRCMNMTGYWRRSAILEPPDVGFKGSDVRAFMIEWDSTLVCMSKLPNMEEHMSYYERLPPPAMPRNNYEFVFAIIRRGQEDTGCSKARDERSRGGGRAMLVRTRSR